VEENFFTGVVMCIGLLMACSITIHYYKAKKKEYNMISISVELKDDWLSLLYEYNPQFNSLVKDIAGHNNWKFDRDDKRWKVKPLVAKKVLNALSNAGADVSTCIEYVDDNIGNIVECTELPIEITMPRLNVLSRSNKLIIMFPYNHDIVKAIKSLTYHKWIPANKSWEIQKSEAMKLYEAIKDIIDSSELEIYRNHGKMAPELKDYTYLEIKPYIHQVQAAQFLIERKKAILADEMGVGKTLSSILAAYSLPSPRIIICPASLKLNWQKEIRIVDSTGTIKIISNEFEIADWIIINYNLLAKHSSSIMESNANCIIFDEAHYIKAIDNTGKPSSQRAKVGLEIANSLDYVFLITGTPMTARPKDLFNLLLAIKHPLASSSSSFYSFAHNYCGAVNNGYGWDYRGASNTEELHENIKGFMLRRYKKDLIDLPVKTRAFIPVDVNLKDYYKAVAAYIKKRKKIKGAEHLAHFNIMRHMLAKSKIVSSIELAENILENGEPIVIFTNFKVVVDEIFEHFRERAVKLTGDCDLEERQKAVDDFQSGQKDVFIANLLAGGIGITLTRANQAIVNDFDWTPSNHAQSEDRIYRIGTKQKCYIRYVYADGAEVDVKMAEVLMQKISNISTVIDGDIIDREQNTMIEEILKMFNR
jgi:SNF2 family DNA or RNA helicase